MSEELWTYADAFDGSEFGGRAGEIARSRFPRGSVWWDVEPGGEPDREDQRAAVEFLTAAFSLWAESNVSEDVRAAAVAYYRDQAYSVTEE